MITSMPTFAVLNNSSGESFFFYSLYDAKRKVDELYYHKEVTQDCSIGEVSFWEEEDFESANDYIFEGGTLESWLAGKIVTDEWIFSFEDVKYEKDYLKDFEYDI